MNSNPEKASRWRGRILMQIIREAEGDPEGKGEAGEDDVPELG